MMDEAGMKNIRAVLYTVLLLTVMTFAVILGLAAAEKPVPDLVVNLGTTLLGVVTGSVVSLSAKPRADHAEIAADNAAYRVKDAMETAGAMAATPLLSAELMGRVDETRDDGAVDLITVLLVTILFGVVLLLFGVDFNAN